MSNQQMFCQEYYDQYPDSKEIKLSLLYLFNLKYSDILSAVSKIHSYLRFYLAQNIRRKHIVRMHDKMASDISWSLSIQIYIYTTFFSAKQNHTRVSRNNK